jgi:Type IV secretion system pilin
MNKLQSLALATTAMALTAESSFAADGCGIFGCSNVGTPLQWGGGTADTLIQRLVGNAMMFLGLLGVLYGIWGGFQIVTAGGDEEKVKKGRTIIIQVAIGLLVIFIANSIVQFILQKILTNA